MNKDAVYYKIKITNNDTYDIKNVYLDITDIVADFDYNFNIVNTNGNVVKYSYVSNNYECYRYINTGIVPIIFPQGNAGSWLSVNEYNLPTTICISLTDVISPNTEIVLLAYPDDVDNSRNGVDIFELYDDFNNRELFSSKFNSSDINSYYVENGKLIIIPQLVTDTNNIITSEQLFNYNSNTTFQIMTRWKTDRLYTVDSSYIGIIKSRNGYNYEQSKYLFSTRLSNCKIVNTTIGAGYSASNWNYGIYNFNPSIFRMHDSVYGTITSSINYTSTSSQYLCVHHSKPTQASNSNKTEYDFIAKTAFPLIAPTYTITKKTKYYETYTDNKKTVLSEPAIDLSVIDNFSHIQILSEELYKAYLRFAFSFDNKNTWVIYNTDSGLWDSVSEDDVVVTNNNLFDDINSKGMLPELVSTLGFNEFEKAINVFGKNNFYIMGCYKSDTQISDVVRDIYEIDITKMYSEEFSVNSSFKKIELAYKGTITINNSSTGMSYVDFPFKINIAQYISINGEDIKIVDSNTYIDVPFTYEYSDGICHSGDVFALPSQVKTGYIWIKYSIGIGLTKQLLVLNHTSNKACEGYEIFSKYCDFTKGISDFFIMDDDTHMDITNYGSTFNNKRGMYYKFDDALEHGEYITEVSSAVAGSVMSNISSGARILLSNIENVPTNGSSINFVSNLYSTLNVGVNSITNNNYMLYDNSVVVQTPILLNTFIVYGMVLNRASNFIHLYKNDVIFRTTTYGSFDDGIDIVRLGYLNSLSDHEELIAATTYKWFRIRKYNETLPTFLTTYEYDDSAIIKTNDDTNFKFNNDFFSELSSVSCHEKKPVNTSIRYLFSFDGARTWNKWSTDEQLFPNGWKNRYILTIDKNRVPSELVNYKLPIKLSSSSGTGHQDCTLIFDHLRNGEYYTTFDSCTGDVSSNWDSVIDSDCTATYANNSLVLNVNNTNSKKGVNVLSKQSYTTSNISTFIFDWNPCDGSNYLSDDGDNGFGLASILPTGIVYNEDGNIPNFNINNKVFMGIKLRSNISKVIEIHAKVNGTVDSEYETKWEFALDNNVNITYRIKLVVDWNKFVIKLYINNIQVNNIMNFNPIIKTSIGSSFKFNLHWHINYRNGAQKFSNILVYNNDSSPLGLRYYNDNRYKIYVTTSTGINCPIEEVSFDCHGRTALILAKIPYISNTSDTTIYLYYDKNHKDNSDITLNGTYIFNNYEYIKNYQYNTHLGVVKRWAETGIDSIASNGNVSTDFSTISSVDFRSSMIANKIDVCICLLTDDNTKTPTIDGFELNCKYNKIDNIAKITGVKLFYENQFGYYTPDISTDITFYKINTDDFAGYYRIKNIIGKVIFNY